MLPDRGQHPCKLGIRFGSVFKFLDVFVAVSAQELFNWASGDMAEFLLLRMCNRREDELPLMLGSRCKIHHYDRLANSFIGIRRSTAQLGDPRLCKRIP